MPGPKSKPQAKDKNGRVITGKTNLRHHNLRSGEGMQRGDYIAVPDKKPGKGRGE